jgi:hypothetical protein
VVLYYFEARFHRNTVTGFRPCSNAMPVSSVIRSNHANNNVGRCGDLLAVAATYQPPMGARLRPEFTPANIFRISTQEWKCITYLIDVNRQFSFWTSNISIASGARLGFVLPTYGEA